MSLLEYHLLVALASGHLHGYAIAERVAAESGGALQPRAGSLYRVIARLVALDLVAESEAEPKVAHPGLARRYYTLTAGGRRVLADETIGSRGRASLPRRVSPTASRATTRRSSRRPSGVTRSGCSAGTSTSACRMGVPRIR